MLVKVTAQDIATGAEPVRYTGDAEGYAEALYIAQGNVPEGHAVLNIRVNR